MEMSKTIIQLGVAFELSYSVCFRMIIIASDSELRGIVLPLLITIESKIQLKATQSDQVSVTNGYSDA